MKRFIKDILIFLPILLATLALLDIISMFEPGRTALAFFTDSLSYITGEVGSDEINPYIEQMREKDGTTILVIGDSMCHQLFVGLDPVSDKVSLAGSNAAITPAGQYILAHEYINAHPDATDIYLFMLPMALEQSFDTNWGYQYTVMPFVETDTLGLLDDDTVSIMEDVYGSFFMKKAVVRMIDRSGPNRKLYLNALAKFSEGYVPAKRFEIADRYIMKIKKMCDENGITLHFHSGPMSTAKRYHLEEIRSEYLESEVGKAFPDYLDEIGFFPSELSSDDIHYDYVYRMERKFLDDVLHEFYDDMLPELMKELYG